MSHYTESQFRIAVAESTSVSGVVQRIGRARVGTNFDLVRKEIARLNLDTSHWVRQPWVSPSPDEEVFQEGSRFSTGVVKKRVLAKRLLPYRCICGLTSEWQGARLVLRLDHINGKRNDHRLENLRFLCPNCDSQTETYCGRNKARKPGTSGFCTICQVNPCKGLRCRSCSHKGNTSNQSKPKIDWPPTSELIRRVSETSYLAVARELGVSDNAIRKRITSRSS